MKKDNGHRQLEVSSISSLFLLKGSTFLVLFFLQWSLTVFFSKIIRSSSFFIPYLNVLQKTLIIFLFSISFQLLFLPRSMVAEQQDSFTKLTERTIKFHKKLDSNRFSPELLHQINTSINAIEKSCCKSRKFNLNKTQLFSFYLNQSYYKMFVNLYFNVSFAFF